MTAPEALSAIAGIQQNLTTLRTGTAAAPATAPTAGTSSADVFGALLTRLLGAATSAPSSFGQKLVDDARAFLGTPYVLGGTTKDGIDCSGLVKTVLAGYGIDAPHSATRQGELGSAVPSMAEARPGDLLVFDDGEHIGIYAGDGKVIHAPAPGRDVVEAELWAQPTAIRRIDAPAGESAAPAQVDVASVLQGLSLLGSLASTLGAGVPASGADPSAALSTLALQRWMLQQKGA